ncbi:hypothetical protein [Cryptosporangium minutisporangium]|uniref:Uncharacterized protein n=1 Tax=Cryptosporangium minutisporangium TaxID=113569 RepID=A0ABP6SYG9_9ACTN
MNAAPLSTAPTRPMRPPTPALIAIVLLTLASVYLAFWLLLRGDLIGLFPLAFGVLWVLVLKGLWQGGHGAFTIALVLAALNILSALIDGASAVVPGGDSSGSGVWPGNGAISLIQLALGVAVVLLLLARSSRAFYARR